MVEIAEAAHTETVTARGHEHVSGTHESTFELTTDEYLTPAGDCILGIAADRAPVAFADPFRAACQNPDATITAVLEAGEHTERITARGNPELTLASDRSLVVRTSEYVDDRTVAVDASAAAADLDRALIGALAAGAPVRLTLGVSP